MKASNIGISTKSIALAAVLGATTLALNLTGPLSLALPPFYITMRFSAPLLFIGVLIDPLGGIFGAMIGNFVYNLMMGRPHAPFTGLLGQFIYYVIFLFIARYRGKITTPRLLIATICTAITKALYISTVLSVFYNIPFSVLFPGILIGISISNVVIGFPVLITVLPRIKEHVPYEVLIGSAKKH